ncbi:hypothetical protein J132_10408 [Termitomyces sp. J132]|nr:hypothetical protein J132_10408 [Termitomyces sp. J132]
MRSHKLSILVTVPPSTTIAEMKQEALSALISPINEVDDVPKVESDNDFELCKESKVKGRPTEYEVLGVSKELKECGLASYDTLYIQFRDSSGELLPVVVQTPSIDDDGEDPSEADFGGPSTSKGKRKRMEQDG